MATVRNTQKNPLDLETMIRIFNKKVERDGIMQAMQDRQYALSKSQRRKRKDLRALKLRNTGKKRRQEAAARYDKY